MSETTTIPLDSKKNGKIDIGTYLFDHQPYAESLTSIIRGRLSYEREGR